MWMGQRILIGGRRRLCEWVSLSLGWRGGEEIESARRECREQRARAGERFVSSTSCETVKRCVQERKIPKKQAMWTQETIISEQSRRRRERGIGAHLSDRLCSLPQPP